MNVVKEIMRINEEELRLGLSEERSWHAQYRGSAWVFIGGLAQRLTEGDVICVFSEWGEVEDLHLVRDDATGLSKGFAFLKYEDWRSTVLAVDNMNGVELLGRTLRVDHKLSYEPPKAKAERDANGRALPAEQRTVPLPMEAGHAYKAKELASDFNIAHGVNLFAAPPPPPLPTADAAAPLPPLDGARASREGGRSHRDDHDDDKHSRHHHHHHRRRRRSDDERGSDADEEHRRRPQHRRRDDAVVDGTSSPARHDKHQHSRHRHRDDSSPSRSRNGDDGRGRREVAVGHGAGGGAGSDAPAAVAIAVPSAVDAATRRPLPPQQRQQQPDDGAIPTWRGRYEPRAAAAAAPSASFGGGGGREGADRHADDGRLFGRGAIGGATSGAGRGGHATSDVNFVAGLGRRR